MDRQCKSTLAFTALQHFNLGEQVSYFAVLSENRLICQHSKKKKKALRTSLHFLRIFFLLNRTLYKNPRMMCQKSEEQRCGVEGLSQGKVLVHRGVESTSFPITYTLQRKNICRQGGERGSDSKTGFQSSEVHHTEVLRDRAQMGTSNYANGVQGMIPFLSSCQLYKYI